MYLFKLILINVINYYFDSIAQLNKNFNSSLVVNFQLKVLQLNIRGMNNINKFDWLKETLELYSGVIDVIPEYFLV